MSLFCFALSRVSRGFAQYKIRLRKSIIKYSVKYRTKHISKFEFNFIRELHRNSKK